LFFEGAVKKVPSKKNAFRHKSLAAFFLFWYNNSAMNIKHYYSPKQGRLPVFISDILNICGPDRNSYSKTDPSATFKSTYGR